MKIAIHLNHERDRNCINDVSFAINEYSLLMCTNVINTCLHCDTCLIEKIADLDSSYPGGLTSYLSKAKILLKESAEGTNPFSDFVASVPVGESLTYGEEMADGHTGMTFSEAEQVGLTGIADVAFVLVAGGLGELW